MRHTTLAAFALGFCLAILFTSPAEKPQHKGGEASVALSEQLTP
jgi:hypothetical protein